MLKKWLGREEKPARYVIIMENPSLPVVAISIRSAIVVDDNGAPIIESEVAKEIAKRNSVDGLVYRPVKLKNHSDTKE